MPGKTYNARRVFRGMVIEKTPAELVASRAAKVPVSEVQSVEVETQTPVVETQGIAARIVGAIDRADAQGRGCSGCKAVRKTARAMIMKVARPQR